MIITFISNALDHIQLPLCDAIFEANNGNFFYIATNKSSAIRSDITAEDINKSRGYVIRSYENEIQKLKSERLISDSDVVIWGTASEEHVIDRIKAGKLTFHYMERIYKEPFTVKNTLYRIISALIHHTRMQKYKVYMLCAGAYASYDHSLMHNYINKCFVWGYFPEYIPNNIEKLLNIKASYFPIEIIWVGRFVTLKHPEQVIKLAEYLNLNNIPCHINMLGYGDLLEYCCNKVKDLKLTNIDILGSRSPKEVREYMNCASILLFTSDRGEGWGAVVNEGMNSACAVVASAAAGVSPFLIKNEKNGLLYDCGSQISLNKKVVLLIKNRELRQKLAKSGYNTVKTLWNPKSAAERFILLSEALLHEKNISFREGPCSPAHIIKDGWYKDEE